MLSYIDYIAVCCILQPFGAKMEAPVIKRLPEDVVCKLRGGVVVPSLARCAEELLLNALRARPTRVEAPQRQMNFKRILKGMQNQNRYQNTSYFI